DEPPEDDGEEDDERREVEFLSGHPGEDEILGGGVEEGDGDDDGESSNRPELDKGEEGRRDCGYDETDVGDITQNEGDESPEDREVDPEEGEEDPGPCSGDQVHFRPDHHVVDEEPARLREVLVEG